MEDTGSIFFLTESKGTAAYVSRIWCSDSSSVPGFVGEFPVCCNPTKRNRVEVNLRLNRSQWPLDLRRGSRSVRLLGFRGRILPGAWMSFSCECVYSGFSGLEVACWPLVPKFAGSNPAEAVGFFRAKKSSARLPSEGK